MTIVSDILSKGVGLLIIITCFALPAGLSVMNIICLVKPKFVRVMGIISWSCTVFFGTILSIFLCIHGKHKPVFTVGRAAV